MAQLNQIGTFTFIWMSQPVPGYRRSFQYEARAGVDGHAIWDTGLRGNVFDVVTKVDTVNVAWARLVLEQYYAAQQFGAVLDVTWADSAETRKVLINAVEPIDGTPKAILGGVGGTYAGLSQGKLHARWRLHQIYEPA